MKKTEEYGMRLKHVGWVALGARWYNEGAVSDLRADRPADYRDILYVHGAVLGLAGACNTGGILARENRLAQRIPLRPAQIAERIHEDVALVEMSLVVLTEYGLLELLDVNGQPALGPADGAAFAIAGWDDMQADALGKQVALQVDRERKANKRLEEKNTKALPEPRDDAREAEIDQIIDIFNEITGKNFRKSTKTTRSAINARMDEGYTVDDIRRVIQQQTDAWAHNPDMCQYLCPETIFRPSKFEKYFQNLSSTSTNGEAEEAWTWALKMLREDVEGYREQASDRIKAAIRDVGGSSWIKQHEEDAHKKFLEIY